jgi:hypothetical protein
VQKSKKNFIWTSWARNGRFWVFFEKKRPRSFRGYFATIFWKVQCLYRVYCWLWIWWYKVLIRFGSLSSSTPAKDLVDVLLIWNYYFWIYGGLLLKEVRQWSLLGHITSSNEFLLVWIYIHRLVPIGHGGLWLNNAIHSTSLILAFLAWISFSRCTFWASRLNKSMLNTSP